MKAFRKCLSWVVVICLVGCAAIAVAQVPYKATLASTGDPEILPPGMPGNDCPNSILFPDGSSVPVRDGVGIFKFVIHAVGNSTLMGLTVDVQTHCVPMPLAQDTPPPGPGTAVPFFNGVATLQGANGDKIFGTYFGIMTVTENGMVIDGTLITNGGTGRFQGATGIGKAFGVQSFSGSSALTVSGTMTSPGAAKK